MVTIATMSTILEINNLDKRFGRVHAVNDVSFSIERGNVYGILGPNGSGKSTTLGIILNVVNATGGNFAWFGGTQSTHDALKKVGAIIERPNFYPYMTAKQNLALVAKIKQCDTARIQTVLETVGLWERRDHKFKTFSLGMKQRLAIASALLNDPEILILDEPTNGLDPQGIHQIREIIKVIASRGTTILLASHLLDEVQKVCSHVVILQRGKMLYQGPVSAMVDGHRYFEVAAADMDALELRFRESEIATEITREGDLIQFVPTQKDLSPAQLNEMLAKEGIFLSHLAAQEKSLENLFLELTNDQYDA